MSGEKLLAFMCGRDGRRRHYTMYVRTDTFFIGCTRYDGGQRRNLYRLFHVLLCHRDSHRSIAVRSSWEQEKVYPSLFFSCHAIDRDTGISAASPPLYCPGGHRHLPGRYHTDSQNDIDGTQGNRKCFGRNRNWRVIYGQPHRGLPVSLVYGTGCGYLSSTVECIYFPGSNGISCRFYHFFYTGRYGNTTFSP